MKLYTEEQVRKMLLQENIFDIDDILDSEIPIELPSDDEIYNESQRIKENVKIVPFHSVSFQYGVYWLRDKILNK